MELSSKKTKPNKNIEKLRRLCDQLNDRDDQLKRDFRMFEDFFSNFPVPVTMWFIGKDHTVLSKHGNAFTCQSPATLEEMFECPELRDESIKRHEQAFNDEVVTYFVKYETKLFWCKLVPRKVENNIAGILGIAWDITSNSIMLHNIQKAKEIIDNSGNTHSAAAALQDALDASRLRKLLKERGMLDE
tara:strand:+ start:53798 stop:54361 length:564 start_codon:yes stop_codon:yes gene_type:complete